MTVSPASTDDQRGPDAQLLRNIKRDLASLTALADEVTDGWAEEDLVYRFWHQSFKGRCTGSRN